MALAGKRLFYRAVFLFVVRSGQQPEIYDGCNSAQHGDYWYRSICFRYVFPLAGKTITLSPHTQRNYPELQKRLNGWLSAALKTARILTVCVAVMLLLSAWGLFDFWNWLQNGAGQKTVDILIRIALILFFSAVGWTVLASLIENRLASDIHGRPLPSARTRTLLTLFRNALAVIISTITIMIVLSEIGVNIAPLLAGAGALGLAISFGSQTLVKDIITGVFIQFENGMNTGDLVTIGPLTGTVERMSIRSVGVRRYRGVPHHSVVFDYHLCQLCPRHWFGSGKLRC